MEQGEVVATTSARSPFVGRDREIGALRAVLDDARESRGGVVVLTGAAGIGKSRLAAEVARGAESFTVVWASAGPPDGAPPFWPWFQVVRALLGDDPELAARARRDWPAALTLLDGERAPDSAAPRDPDAARGRLFEDVVALLAARARVGPLLIVLDDLHRVDPSSRQLFAHVAPRLHTERVALVATWRTGDPTDGVRPVPRELGPVDVLPVPPLAAGALTAMVESITGASDAGALVDAVHRRSSGNPLLAQELLGQLDVAGGHDAATVAGLLPDSVRTAVADRLVALPPAARDAVTWAAVVGTAFPVDVVAAASGEDELALLDALDRARATNLFDTLDASGGRFSHDVIRDAVYDACSPAERARRHRVVGEALEVLRARGRRVDDVDLARHFLAAGPPSADLAAAYARTAANTAMAMLAYEEAVVLAERSLGALATTDAPPEARAELLVDLARARVAAGERERGRAASVEAFVEAQRAGRAELMATAALGLGGPSGFEVTMGDREQVDLLRAALAALAPAAGSLRASLLARLSIARSGLDPVEDRMQLADEAVAVARACGDDAALARGLAARCDAIAGPDHVAQRAVTAREIVELAERSGDLELELHGRRLSLVAALEQGDVVAVDREILAYEAAAASLRLPMYSWFVPLWQAMRAAMAGRIDDAVALLETAERLGEAAESGNAAELTITFRWCLVSELGPREELVELFSGFDDFTFVGIWPFVTKALVRATLGELDAARAELDAVAPRLPVEERDSEWVPMLAQVADVVGRIGGHPIAEWAYDALLPYRSQLVVEGIGAYVRGPVEHWLGVLAAACGDTDAAAGHFDAALATCARVGAPYLAGLVRRDRDRDLAAEPAPRGADVFTRDGDGWRLAFDGEEVRVRDAKGLHDVHRLLAAPGRPIPVLDLAGVGGRGTVVGNPDDLHEPGDLGDVVDATAREAYRRRLVELDEEADDADAAGDAERSARAVAERDALVQELNAALGLGGRPRRAGDAVERARSTVTARIRDAIGRVGAVHPALGRHLRHSVQTGRVCVYEPETPVDWTL